MSVCPGLRTNDPGMRSCGPKGRTKRRLFIRGLWSGKKKKKILNSAFPFFILLDFSVIHPPLWADNTDSICDLPSVLTFLDNFTSKRYRTNATSSSPATGRSARGASNGAAAPSSLPSSSSLLQPPLPPHSAPAAAPASPRALSSSGSPSELLVFVS